MQHRAHRLPSYYSSSLSGLYTRAKTGQTELALPSLLTWWLAVAAREHAFSSSESELFEFPSSLMLVPAVELMH